MLHSFSYLFFTQILSYKICTHSFFSKSSYLHSIIFFYFYSFHSIPFTPTKHNIYRDYCHLMEAVLCSSYPSLLKLESSTNWCEYSISSAFVSGLFNSAFECVLIHYFFPFQDQPQIPLQPQVMNIYTCLVNSLGAILKFHTTNLRIP